MKFAKSDANVVMHREARLPMGVTVGDTVCIVVVSGVSWTSTEGIWFGLLGPIRCTIFRSATGSEGALYPISERHVGVVGAFDELESVASLNSSTGT